MTLERLPADAAEHEVLAAAMAQCAIDAADGTQPNRSPWSTAALSEGVARDPREDDGYALSPRSTRGATRA